MIFPFSAYTGYNTDSEQFIFQFVNSAFSPNHPHNKKDGNAVLFIYSYTLSASAGNGEGIAKALRRER